MIGELRQCSGMSPERQATRDSPRQTGRSVRHSVEVPLAGDAFEFVLAAVLEGYAGAGDEVFDGAGDEYLSRLCVCGHAGARVDGDAGDLAVDQFALAGVQARANLETEFRHRLDDRASAGDCTGGSVERGKEPVSCRVHFFAAEAAELCSNGLVVTLQELAPGAIAKLRGT